MSHGVEKSTYVDADEKTSRALTYDMLNSLYNKAEETADCQRKQIKVCDGRFGKLESKKKRDTKVAAISGVAGGFIAMVVYYIKKWIAD